MISYKKRWAVFILLFFLIFSFSFESKRERVFATENVSLEGTDVLEDLTSSTVNGKAFDVKDYPFDEEGRVQVLNFVEFCYSYRKNMREDYGLYLYIYNPQALKFSMNHVGNQVQMAIAYEKAGSPTDYAKFSLRYCSQSTGRWARLFYKFRVIDKEIDGKTFSERVNSIERRYDISSIELVTAGDSTATDYPVGGTYYFSGYAKGYGPNVEDESTLSSKAQYLETVSLDVQRTFYRTKSSSKGANYQHQIDTVYFSVPNRFFEEYGRLQRIKAEWYEYKTKDIVVTSEEEVYNKVKPYLGEHTQIDEETWAFNTSIGAGFGENTVSGYQSGNRADWGWNIGLDFLGTQIDKLYYLFLVSNIEEYDPYADIVSNGGVTSNALYRYILNYSKTFENGTLPIKDGTISADLFESDIDEYRKLDNAQGKIRQGYSYYDFDADVDIKELQSWSDTKPSFWDNWNEYGLGDILFGNIPEDTGKTVAPIYILKSEDLNGADASISDNLLIHSQDVSALKQYKTEADAKGETVVLFRFATSDYYSAPLQIVERDSTDMYASLTYEKAYRAWESVFFDFDIIQLTFYRDGVYTVIPVVSNPMDIVNAITPPTNMGTNSIWKLLLGILAFIVLLILLLKLLPLLISGVVYVIRLPFQKRKEKKKRGKDKEG